jgi:hypothetical protein
MSSLHYPDLYIKGFRGIKELSIPRLGRVTLITGKNNTGKSSVLEALRLHTQNAAPPVVVSILESREEYVRGTDEEDRYYDPESVFPVSTLFHGFPRLSENFEPIVISTSGKTYPMNLRMWVGWSRHDSDGNRHPIPGGKPFSGESEGLAYLAVEIGEGTEAGYSMQRLLQYARQRRRTQSRIYVEGLTPCVFVNPYSGKGTSDLGPLWDGIALTDGEKDVVEALHIIDPHISAVSMVGGEAPSRRRMAMVRADNAPRPLPLRSFGDGVNRLFAMALSLVNARDGILLIDEFENGLHYSVQLDAWRMIFKLAQRLDVQVFATTHSWDTIEAFQKAAAESPEEGMYLRLSRWRDGTLLLDFEEEELTRATRHKMEIR